MESKIKYQKAYLIIIAVILIVIVGVVGGLVTYVFVGKSKSNVSAMHSKAAFYIATSGLEIAKHDLINNGVLCNSLPAMAKYQNACFPPDASGSDCKGYFNVTAVRNQAQSILAATIGSSDTYIPLQTSSAFLPNGVAIIGSEIVKYGSKDSGGLREVSRGVLGTSAGGHEISSAVSQDVCTVTSTGSVPTPHGQVPPPQGERTVQQLVFGKGYGYFVKLPPGGTFPAVVVEGNVNIEGAGTVINSSIDGKGCAVASTGVIAGKVTKSECVAGHYEPNILWTDPNLLAGEPLYDYLFLQQPLVMASNGVKANYNSNTTIFENNINTAISSGSSVVWVDGPVTLKNMNVLTNANRVITFIVFGDLTVETNVTIGSIDNPVKMIVMGKFIQDGGAGIINGLLYVDGGFSVTQTGSFLVNGALAAKGDVVLKNSEINLDRTVLDKLSAAQPGMVQLSTPEIYN